MTFTTIIWYFAQFTLSLQRMLTKTQAIVLHSLKYGETRLIVDMFTRSQGRQSFIVSIPKSVKGKIKKQLFQPLTLLEIESPSPCSLQSSSIMPSVLNSTTNRCSTISSTASSGSMPKQTVLPTSIWCFSCDSPVSWVSIRISTTIRLAITSTSVRVSFCQLHQYIATSFILRKPRRYN